MKLTIGEVVFAKRGGGYSRYIPLIGIERVGFLRRLYHSKPLPPGWSAIALNPQREITRDDVNWDTAGDEVTREVW